MIVRSKVRLGVVLHRSWRSILFAAAYPTLVFAAHDAGIEGLTVPMAIPAMLGTALSILLGFRTNSAYARWWEARQVWGGIVNDSRTLARQVISLFTLPEGANEQYMLAMQRQIVYRQIAWNYTLARTLRRQDPYADIEETIVPKETAALRSQDNLPNAMLQTQADQLNDAVQRGYLDTLRLLRLQDMLRRLCDHMGKCERIKNTVFPVHYAFLVSVIIWLFVLLLPLGLVPLLGWITVPVAFLVSVVFYLISATSATLQDPFENYVTDTPMLALSRTIEINLRQQLGETELPDKAQPEDGVLM